MAEGNHLLVDEKQLIFIILDVEFPLGLFELTSFLKDAPVHGKLFANQDFTPLHL